MTSERHIKLGKKTLIISFIIGILIFGLYFHTSSFKFISIGLGFIFIAGIVNIVILFSILAKSESDPKNRRGLRKTAGLMLINLPITIIFIWLAMILIGNMRITFINSTPNTLTDINIIGCEMKHIPELEPNESETVWIGITGDCSITLEYLENGKLKRETVATYVTSGMGQKANHKIDGENKDLL